MISGTELVEILNDSEQYEEAISNAAIQQLGRDIMDEADEEAHAVKWKEIKAEVERKILLLFGK